MGSSTSPDSLYKPTVGEEGWGNAVNANMDTIQAAITELRPGAISETWARWVTDTNPAITRYNTGSPISAANLDVPDFYFVDWTSALSTAPSSEAAFEAWLGDEPYTQETDYWAQPGFVWPAGSFFELPTPARYVWTVRFDVDQNPGTTIVQYGQIDFLETHFSTGEHAPNGSDTSLNYGWDLLSTARKFPRSLGGSGVLDIADENEANYTPCLAYLDLNAGGITSAVITRAFLEVHRVW